MNLDPESTPYQPYNPQRVSSFQDNQWFSNESDSQSSTNYSGNQYSYANNNTGTLSYNDPGSMSNGQEYEDYDNEPPLLEELGIRFDHMWMKTQAVVHPFKNLQENILDDADLVGPICFCLLMGSFLLLSGKVHFGYIYGFSVFGCIGMYSVLNLVSERSMDFLLTCSVLGYCLLPVIGVAGLAILIRLKSWVGTLLSFVAIVWSTHAATRLFVAKMALNNGTHYALVAYPTMLLYSAFVLITIF